MVAPNSSPDHADGPLAGIRVVELGAIGPGPLCAMLLADLGADVLRVDRATAAESADPASSAADDLINRGRRSVAVDLKHERGAEVVLRLVDQADALIEGYRPGVAERLGIGPDVCLERNSGLVYGRMTGWGQDGPLADAVGHDLNYIAVSGVLGLIGREGQPPTPPLNLVGDGGGGGVMLAFGMLAALLERARSGRGQVVDAAMIEGSAVLAITFLNLAWNGRWIGERGRNLVDSGAPFYDTYETSDGRWLTVAALEPRFYQAFLELLGLDAEDLPAQHDRSGWPELRRRFAAIIASRTRDAWTEAAATFDACVAPVLGIEELEDHPHLRARGTYVRHGDVLQPAPTPRFSRTPGALGRRPPLPGEHTSAALADWGFDAASIAELTRAGAVAELP